MPCPKIAFVLAVGLLAPSVACAHDAPQGTVASERADASSPARERMATFDADGPHSIGVATATPVTLDRVRVEGRAPSMAATTLDAMTLEQQHLRSLAVLRARVPTLSITATGGRATPHYVSLRGYTNPWSAPESAVAVYLDGVPVSDFFALGQRLFDLDRVDVLRGPQGSAFGMNAEAGVIDVYTHAPDADASAWMAVSAGSRGTAALETAATGALARNVSGHIAASLDRSDGTIDNRVGHRPYDAQRGRNLHGKLRWHASESVQIDLLLLDRRVDDHGGEQYLPVDRAAFNALPTLQGVQLGRFDQAIDHEGYNRLGATQAALTARWNVAGVRWRATASHRDSDSATSTDYDLSPQPWFVMDARYRVREDHAELRGDSARDDARWQWLAGLSLDRRRAHTLRIFNAGVGNPWFLPPGAYVRTDATLPDRTAALFGESRWRFGEDDCWTVTAGARIEHDQRRLEFGANALAAGTTRERADTQWLPKLAVELKLAPTHALYASLARGGKAGGFNPGSFDGTRTEYRPERTLAAELGAHGSFADGRFDYRFAAFAPRIDDYQALVLSEREFTQYVANVERARTRGVEAELSLQATPRWRVDAMLGRVRARYDDYVIDRASNTRLDGHPLQQVPHWNARVAARYERDPWWLDLAVIGAGGFTINAFDAPTATLREETISGHASLGLHGGWRGERWSLQLDADNLADRRWFTTASFGFHSLAGYDGAMGAVAPGRTLRLALRRDF